MSATELLIPRRSGCVIGAEFARSVDERLPVPDFFSHSAGRLTSEAVSGETKRSSRDATENVLRGESFTRVEGNRFEGWEALTQVAKFAVDGDDDGTIVVRGTDISDANTISGADGVFFIGIPFVRRRIGSGFPGFISADTGASEVLLVGEGWNVAAVVATISGGGRSCGGWERGARHKNVSGTLAKNIVEAIKSVGEIVPSLSTRSRVGEVAVRDEIDGTEIGLAANFEPCAIGTRRLPDSSAKRCGEDGAGCGSEVVDDGASVDGFVGGSRS